MEFTSVKKQQWSEIKEIYMEAFPKCERKPFFYCASQLREKSRAGGGSRGKSASGIYSFCCI
ncbi:MAG: hypothetical protein ACLTBL_08535 [Clostridium sp.]